MSQRIRTWLAVVVVLVPLAAFAYRPDLLAPLVQRAFAYPLDVVWLLAYDTLFAVFIWRSAPPKRRTVAAMIALLACFWMTVAYALVWTQTLWGVALVVPPVAATIASFIRTNNATGRPTLEPPNKSLERTPER